MKTNTLLKFLLAGMVQFCIMLIILAGSYLLFKPAKTIQSNEADINAIYQVVGEFGARLKEVVITTSDQDMMAAVDSNFKQLITDRLYQVFGQDKIRIPGRYVGFPWPDRIKINALQLLESGAYTIHGSLVLMTEDTVAHGGNAGESAITLTLKKIKGSWLIDDVIGGPKG